jgi:hypothetical protein
MKPMDVANYDASIEIAEDALRRCKLGNREKLTALRRLASWGEMSNARVTMSRV